MSERYVIVFSLPEKLYAEGAPVIVSAGNLLKDQQTGKILAQLKIKNISDKAIKAVNVFIHALDTTGKAIEGDVEQEYLDLSVKQGEEFGQKSPIWLPNASTRELVVEVKRVVFVDKSIWEAAGKEWEPLPEGERLSGKLGDPELVKQYQLRFGGDCEYALREEKDLWLCACGAWNKGEACYACGKNKTAQKTLDLDGLKAEKEARLAAEKAEREAKEAADRAAAEAKRKRIKKLTAIAVPVAVLCLAALLFFLVFMPGIKYNKAMALLEEGKYEEAEEAFEALGDYKDSGEQAEKAEKLARLARAKEILSGQEYHMEYNAYDTMMSTVMVFHPDGSLDWEWKYVAKGFCTITHSFINATYEPVAYIDDNRLLVKLSMDGEQSTTTYEAGRTEETELRPPEYMIVYLSYSERVNDYRFAEVVVAEKGERLPDMNSQWNAVVFMNRNGEIWKVEEIDTPA